MVMLDIKPYHYPYHYYYYYYSSARYQIFDFR